MSPWTALLPLLWLKSRKLWRVSRCWFPHLCALPPIGRPYHQVRRALQRRRRLPIPIASIEHYQDALNAFDAHPLKRTAIRTAAFSGSAQPSVLVLCDKPRNEEDRAGEVLSGNNQVLASRMLAAIGLDGREHATRPWHLRILLPGDHRATARQRSKNA